MNGKQCHDEWVAMLAEQVVQDVTDIMAGIQLTSSPQEAGKCLDRDRFDRIWGVVSGDVRLYIQIFAEPSFFTRLAWKISGEMQEDPEVIQEYALEYANTIYGRFVAELFRASGMRMRCNELRYEKAPFSRCECSGQQINTVRLHDTENEPIIFSWMAEDNVRPQAAG